MLAVVAEPKMCMLELHACELRSSGMCEMRTGSLDGLNDVMTATSRICDVETWMASMMLQQNAGRKGAAKEDAIREAE
jgi:hypothetical protein